MGYGFGQRAGLEQAGSSAFTHKGYACFEAARATRGERQEARCHLTERERKSRHAPARRHALFAHQSALERRFGGKIECNRAFEPVAFDPFERMELTLLIAIVNGRGAYAHEQRYAQGA